MSSDYENLNVPEIDDTPSIRVHIAELVLIANARVLPARRVSLTAALTVADRVLARSSENNLTARSFAVERAVERFISLATLGPRTNETVEHLDLLPISHPFSTAASGLTASAIADARAEWLSADPRIADELRPLVASIQTMEFGSIERMHALARLEAAGRDVPLDLVALIADGNSSAARSARAKRQLRDRLKRFAFEGHMGSFLVRFGSKVKSQLGVLVGGSSTTNTGELYITEDDAPLGLKKGDILPVNLDNFESLGVVLTTDQLNRAGIELPAGKASTVKRAQDIKDLLANKLEAPSDWKKLPNGDFTTEDGFIATPKGDLKYELKDSNGNVVEGLEAAEWPAIQAHIKKSAEDEFGNGNEQAASVDTPTYEKKDLKVDQLYKGDLLPHYYPIQGAEANLLKKREADPNYELPPTEEILGIYKGKVPTKYGIKIRNLKTGKEKYFEVNKTARIYDVRQKQLPKVEVKPAAGSLDNLGIDFQSATMDANNTRLPTPGAFTGEFQNIMQGAQSWKDVQDRLQGQTITYFDFETTGIADYDGQDIANDSVQLGAVKVKDGKIIGRFNVYTNPESKLSEWSAKNLGRDVLDENGNRVLDEKGKPTTTPVTPEWLAQQKSKDDAIKEFMAFIGPNALLGGQNVPFDVEILKRMADDAGVKLDIAGTIDSKDLASLLPKYDPEKGTDGPKAPDRKTGEIKATSSLGPVANFLGFEPANWHSADGDAEDSYNLVSKIIDRAATEDNQDFSLLDFPAMKKRYEERMAEFKSGVSYSNPATDNQKKALEEFSNSTNPVVVAKAKDALASAKTRGEAASVLQELHAADAKTTPQGEPLVDKTGPEIKLGDVVILPSGKRGIVSNKFSMDSGDKIMFKGGAMLTLDEPNTLKVVATPKTETPVELPPTNEPTVDKTGPEIKVGDVVVTNDGKRRTVAKKFSIDSGDMIKFTDGSALTLDEPKTLKVVAAPSEITSPEPSIVAKPVQKPAPKNRPSKKQKEMIRSMLRERVMTSEERQGYMDRLASIDKFDVNTLFNELKVLPKATVALTDGNDPLNQHENPELAKIKEKLAPFDLDGSIRRYIDEKTANGEEITSQEISDLLKVNKNWGDSLIPSSDYNEEGKSLRSALNFHKAESETKSSVDSKAPGEEAAKASSDPLDDLKNYDNENSELSKLIDSGASSKEIFDWLDANSPLWKSRESEYNTSWAVDFPTPSDKARWKKFGELKSSITALDKNDASTEGQPNIEFLSGVSEKLPENTISSLDEQLGKAFNGDSLSELVGKAENEEDLQRVVDEISAVRAAKDTTPQQEAQLAQVQDAVIKKFYENHPELENTMAEPANIVVPTEPLPDGKPEATTEIPSAEPVTQPEQSTDVAENPFSTDNSDKLLAETGGSRSLVTGADMSIAMILDKQDIGYEPMLKGVSGNENIVQNLLDSLDESDGANSIAIAGDLYTLHDALYKEGAPVALTEYLKKLADSIDSFTPAEGGNKNNVVTVDTIKEEQAGNLDLSKWKKVGGQKGSNPGGTFENPATGEQVYVKAPKSQLHGENERLASAIYDAAGISSAKVLAGKDADGIDVTYSPMIDGAKQDLKKNLNNKEYMARLQQGFAIDALLANWDVIGLDYDNVVTDKNGEPVRVDPGGALLFRAQGSPKGGAFGEDVPELDAFTDKTSTRPSAKVFSQMSDEQKLESAKVLQNLSTSQIDELVDSIITDPAKQEELKTKLKARRQYILDKFGLSDKPAKKKNPEAGSSGKTKKLDVNGDNDSLKTQLEDAAKNGDLVSFKYNDKERVVAPTYVWTNPKNGNINMTGDEDGVSKNYTLQNFKPSEVDVPEEAPAEPVSSNTVPSKTLDDIVKAAVSKYEQHLAEHDGTTEDIANAIESTIDELRADVKSGKDLDANETAKKMRLLGALYRELADAVTEDAGDGEEPMYDYSDEPVQKLMTGAKELESQADLISPKGDAAAKVETPTTPVATPVAAPESALLNLADEKVRTDTAQSIQSQLPDGYTASPEKGVGSTGFIMVKNEQDETVAMMTLSDDGKEYQVQNFKAGWKIESTSDLNDATAKLVSATKIVNEGGQAVQLSDGTAGKMGSKVVHSKNGITGTIVGFQKDPNYVKVKPDSGGVIKIMSINQIKSNGSGGEGTTSPATPNAPEAPSAPEAPKAPKADTFIQQKSENMTMFTTPNGEQTKVMVIKNGNGTWDVVYDFNGPNFNPLYMDIDDRDEAESKALTALEKNNFESEASAEAEPAKPTGPKKFTFDFMGLQDVEDAPEIKLPTDPLDSDNETIKTDSAGTLIKPGAIVKDEKGRFGVYRSPGYGDAKKMRMIWEDGTQDSVMPDTITATGKYLSPGIAGVYAGLADLDFEKKSEPKAESSQFWLTDKNGKGIGSMEIVVDKQGDTGVVVNSNGDDGYIQVAYPDGTKKRKANTVTATGQRYTEGWYNIKIAQKHFKNLNAEKYNLPTFGAATKSGAPKKAPSGKLSVPKNGAGAKPQQVEQLGWNQSGFEGAPSLEELLSKVSDTSKPGSGLAGGSIALDADAVEDLDLRIMAATGTDGKDAYLMKYKLTSWAGDELANKLVEMVQNNDPRVSATTGLSIPENLVDGDKVSFMPSLNGKGASYKSGYGQTFIVTLDDGTKIYFLRADVPTKHSSGQAKIASNGPRAYHNKVMILAPKESSTPESLALSLNTAGVQDVRPSTNEDAKILIENRLMSMLDEKVDPKSNLSGSDRAASLQRIKDKWGIAPENVTITTGAGGRIEMRLDPESAKKIANKTNIKVLLHTLRSQNRSEMQNPKAGETEEQARDRIADYFVNRVATPQGGLLSTTTRWSEGVPTSGQSSSRDIETGGADYVFTTPKFGANNENTRLLPTIWFDPERAFQRLDFWANQSDKFGKRDGKSPIDQAVPGGYEVMFKGRLSFDDAAVLMVIDEDMRTRVITKLRQKGVTQLGGRPLEAVIMTGPDYAASKKTTK